MNLAYSKYHALGNDYIVVDPQNLPKELTPEQIGRSVFQRRSEQGIEQFELAEWISMGDSGPLFVGGPQTVAICGGWSMKLIDGFNLAYAVTWRRSATLWRTSSPESRKRSVCRARLRAGTFREKLSGVGPRCRKVTSARDTATSQPPALDAAE